MKVRIRSWKSMEKEFKLDKYGNIQIGNKYFIKSMKPFCNKKVKLCGIFDGIKANAYTSFWKITEEMIKKKDRKKFKKYLKNLKKYNV